MALQSLNSLFSFLFLHSSLLMIGDRKKMRGERAARTRLEMSQTGNLWE